MRNRKNKQFKTYMKGIEGELFEKSLSNVGLEIGGSKLYACWVHLEDGYVVQDINVPELILMEFPYILDFLQTGRRIILKYVDNQLTEGKTTKRKRFPYPKTIAYYSVKIEEEDKILEIVDDKLEKVLSSLEEKLVSGLDLYNSYQRVKTIEIDSEENKERR